MSDRLRNFCFTINNPTQGDISALASLDTKFCFAAQEHGEGDGTPHLQGYAELTKQTAFNIIKAALPRAHIEKRKGSAKQALAYCKKGQQSHAQWTTFGESGEDFGKNLVIKFESGSLSTQGKRSDLEQPIQDIQEGKRLKDVATDFPVEFVKFSKGLQALYELNSKPRDMSVPKEVIVHFGPTGTGKTYTALKSFPEAHKQDATMGGWWDGYDRHEVVIIDEFRAQIPFGALLQILDVYPLKLQVKGTHTQLVADKIIITAPEHPVNWYKSLDVNDGKLDQLKRRITAIKYFGPEGIEDHTDKPWSESAAIAEAFEQFN